MRHYSLSVVVPLLALSACAQTPRGPVSVATVPVYDSTQVALDRYTVVRRIGVEGAQSAFRIRGHSDLESAKRAVVAAAAEAGADGVINLTCFDKTDGLFKADGYYCYGNAIRVRN